MNHFFPPVEALRANVLAVLVVFILLVILMARKEAGWVLIETLWRKPLRSGRG